MSAVFYHTEDQKRLILEARDRSVPERGGRVFTRTLPASVFYPAEEYHQKYSLQREPAIMKVLSELYPDRRALFDSTAAARLNGYVAGHLTLEELRDMLLELDGISPQTRKRLLDSLSKLNR